MGHKEFSPSRKLAVKVIYAAFVILKERGGDAPGREVMSEVEKRVELNDWEKSILEKSGYIRWQSILHFFSIDCVKAGFLVKKKGVWYLTPEGEKAMDLGDAKLLEEATKAYKKWAKERADDSENDNEELADEASDKAIEAKFDEIEQQAIEGIKAYILKKNAYEFQDLVAALLRGMGYYTPFVAPKGKDGGIDVIAYKDPLGAEIPRMKVQIKHRQNSASVSEIRELMGLLQKDGDVGIYISSGGFTSEAKITARNASVHLELIDLTRFIELWQEFYNKMDDEEKTLLPMVPIYFIAPSE